MEKRVVEKLVANYLWLDLKEAQKGLIRGNDIQIEIAGDTPGEKLAYIAAAIWVLEKMRDQNCDFNTAYQSFQETIR